jgi:hypothetical protein
MYFLDHPPPHFEAVYGEHEANVSIATGNVIEGRLPQTAARLVKEGTLAHQAGLLANWDRAGRGGRTLSGRREVTVVRDLQR